MALFGNLVAVQGNLHGLHSVPGSKNTEQGTGGPSTQSSISGKYVTENLAYPTGVEYDPTQGHYIIFEIMEQKPGRLSAYKVKEHAANVQADIVAKAKKRGIEMGGNAFGAPAVSQHNADTNQTEVEYKVYSGQKLRDASVQMKNATTVKMDTMIALYMPPSVQVSYNVTYEDQEIGVKAETGLAAIQAFMGKQGGTWDKVKAGGMAVGEGLAAGTVADSIKWAGKVAQGADTLIQIERGQVITPRMELMFEGMGRRSFSYSFTFIPKSEQEAIIIEKIVKKFKKHMMPAFSDEFTSGADGVREMTIPDHFNIRYMYKGELNTHLNRIATCALKSMNVDYGAERFTGYAGGRPQTTKISLNFTEFNIMSKQHIEEGY